MARKGISIKRKDKHRILLTETLPFELPVFFTNQRLYDYSKLTGEKVPYLIRFILKGGDERIPYEFSIQRGDGRQRSLAIMHPACQLDFVDFYTRWDAYILNQCAKSTFSLRRPVQIGSVYFEPSLADENEPIHGDIGDLAPTSAPEQRSFASTYFYYAQYNQIWKFFDSTEFRRIEQDFRSMRSLDVSKCFKSLYTHTISWAVRSKDFAKKHRDSMTFDSAFDRLMSNANWGETNGILIGPEISRIFAEVILQQIDAAIMKELHEQDVLPSHVAIRRYVDDYFVFFNESQFADKAQACIEACLGEYNLSLNESKTSTISAPLITDLSIARDRIRALLNQEIGDLFPWKAKSSGEEASSREVNERSADNLIRQIKSVIKVTGTTYSTISPYALGIISRVLFRANRSLTNDAREAADARRVYSALSFLLDVAFFLYRMDVRVNTTYKISSILIAAKEIAERFGSTGNIIRQEMVDHCSSVLRQARRAKIGDSEISSLLSAVFFVGGDSAVDPVELANALDMRAPNSAPNYFQIVTALYCAKSQKEYAQIREQACHNALYLFRKHSSDCALRTDLTLLYFDFLSCPYVDEPFKAQATAAVSEGLLKKPLADSEANAVRNFVTRHLGTCDWHAEGLPALLRRKELKPAYD